MDCRKCHKSNPEENIFCASCGTRLTKRQFNVKTVEAIKNNPIRAKRWLLLIASMVLLLMSIGSLSVHNAGYINNDQTEEVRFTQSSLHYLEGFKHFLLDTSRVDYAKVVNKQVLEHPTDGTVASFEESYSHRNIIGFNFVRNDIETISIAILLVDVALVFLIIGLPLTMFVFMCIEFQLKSDNHLRFKNVFLLSGFSAILLSRMLLPAYGFQTKPSSNLVGYIILSFIVFFLLEYIEYHRFEKNDPARQIQIRKAIYSIMIVLAIVVATGNLTSIFILTEGGARGSISMIDTTKIFIGGFQLSELSDLTISRVFDSMDRYRSTTSLSWETFLEIRRFPIIWLNKGIFILRYLLLLVSIVLTGYHLKDVYRDNQRRWMIRTIFWIMIGSVLISIFDAATLYQQFILMGVRSDITLIMIPSIGVLIAPIILFVTNKKTPP